MGELHHLKVGCADASVIISNGDYFLIDTHGIEDYSNLLPENRHFRGVIITHQHYDHFDGMRYLKEEGYKTDFLIYSPYERRHGDNSVDYEEWREFEALKDHFVEQGAETRTPYRQSSWDEPFWRTSGMTIWMLGPAKSIATEETRALHDACLVVKIHFLSSKRRCLFTGDASDKNLNHIAHNTKNICDDILHASHHGSIYGADLDFVKKCNAAYTVISTESGVHDNVPHPSALQRYKDNTSKKVYRTDVDGSLKWNV